MVQLNDTSTLPSSQIHSLAILQTPSLGTAYEIFQLASLANLQSLEISPLGTKGHLIIEGESKLLFDFLIQIKSDVFSQEEPSEKADSNGDDSSDFIVKLCQVETEVIETYLSLKQGQMKDHLLIVEGPFLGDLFEVAMELKTNGFNILDLRCPKTEPAHCFGFFSIVHENWNIDLQLKLKGLIPEQMKWKIIENPHPDLRSYFEL
jgi:hypothetical protein